MKEIVGALMLMIFMLPTYGAIIDGSKPSNEDHFKLMGRESYKDFRYPNIIVDPIPTCTINGSFVHPRNCSWFYRCHDFQEGYYQRTYYECEPGTIFNDDLDQCVWGGWQTCNPGATAAPIIQVTGMAVSQTTLSPPTVIFATTAAQIVTQSTPTTSAQTNPTITNGPPSPPLPFNTTPAVSTSPTPTASLVSITANSSSPTHSTPIAALITLISPTPPPAPAPPCFILTDKCSTREVCIEPNRYILISLELCEQSVKLCLPDNSDIICPQGQLYSKSNSKCFKQSDLTCLPPPTTSSTTTTTITTPRPVVIGQTLTINCPRDGYVPDDPNVARKYCDTQYLCNSDKTFKGTEITCSTYPVCQGGGIIEKSCDLGFTYFMKQKICNPVIPASSLC